MKRNFILCRKKLFAIALTMLAMTLGTQSCSDDETETLRDLTINPRSTFILVNETATLEAKVYPEASNGKFAMVWKSDNPSVASVDGNGLVTALSLGKANITVSPVDHELMVRTCTVTVISSSEISLSTANLRLQPGAVHTLKAEITPSSIAQDVTWSSSNPSVATVDGSGAVTAVTAGTATVTATSVADPSKTAECAVMVVNVSSFVAGDRLAGRWTFDDGNAPGKSFLGLDLIPHGDGFTPVEGPDALNSAVRIAQGSYYEALHGIAANGGGQRVNNYTLMVDFRVSQLNRYYCFMQTTLENNDDGDFFLRPAGNLGIGGTGYSEYVATTEEWHRLVISASMGNAYNYYIDGELIHQGNLSQATLDSRWSWLPEGVLLFADEDGEDAEIDIAEVMIWSEALTGEQIAELGGVISEDGSSPLVGVWTFEDAGNLTKATIGADLTAGGGAYTSIDGPDGTKAVKPGSGSTLTIHHGIGANGGGSKVNEYTLMLDVRGSVAEFAGWLSVCNTRDGNSGEGVLWIDGDGKIGYATLGGYSSDALSPDTWHRVVIAAKLGESLKVYIDGNPVFTARSSTDVDGLMSLPLDGVYIGADGAGYPGPSFAEVRIWNMQLTDAQIAELGGAK
jgi:hypothetical protein